MTFPEGYLAVAATILARAKGCGLRMATAESCTGGLIIGCLTEVPGSSAVVERGFVTYDDAAKREMLGVPGELIERVGAVSEEVARAMAEGALERAPVDLVIAVTGIAGPGGATPDKPVGLVHFALARTGADTVHRQQVFEGDRSAIRLATVDVALEMILAALGEPGAPAMAGQGAPAGAGR